MYTIYSVLTTTLDRAHNLRVEGDRRPVGAAADYYLQGLLLRRVSRRAVVLGESSILDTGVMFVVFMLCRLADSMYDVYDFYLCVRQTRARYIVTYPC